MRIAIVSQNFYPEEFKVNDLVKDLVKRGHEVIVLTGKPNYPKGEYFEGYKFIGVKKENYEGASVIRVPVVKRAKGGSIRLIINYFSFVFFASYYILMHKIKVDAVFCFAPSPITQVLPAILLKKKNKCNLSIWYQDLWPESVYAITGIKNHLFQNCLEYLVKFIYKSADKILIQSEAFKESILCKGDYSDKLIYVPNWAEDVFLNKKVDNQKYKSLFPSGFVVMYAGNIGEAQDVISIMKAINLTKENMKIQYVFVGEGRAKASAEKVVDELGLQNVVRFLGRFPVTEMPLLFCHANAMIVSLKNDDLFAFTIPSRIQSYMASGKAIVTMLNGIGSKIIAEAACGFTANSGDYKMLARNIVKMSTLSKEELNKMASNSQNYYRIHFSKEKIIDLIEANIG